VTQTTPVSAWLTTAGQTVLAVPVLALTLLGAAAPHGRHRTDRHPGPPPAVYPLIAQLTGWCALTVAAAACCGRTRYADLGGADAVPVSLASIELAWYTPGVRNLLVTPPTGPLGATVAWLTVAAGGTRS
jgi:hypothetical protein